jgi:hypothetical protein
MAAVTRILFLAANPRDTQQLQLNKELNRIDEELLKSRLRDKFDLQHRQEVSVRQLQGLLLRYEPKIVHFSGHGSQESALVFQDEQGNSQIAPPTALTKLFEIINSPHAQEQVQTNEKIVQCVVLNACYAERQAEAISKYVPCVIGMSSAISDEAAIIFAASFYRALGYGQSVNNAFLLASNDIALLNIPEDATPRLKYAPGVDPAKVYLTGTSSLSSNEPIKEAEMGKLSEMLSPSDLKLVKTYEAAMLANYNVYLQVYPTLATENNPITKAQTEQQLKRIVEQMCFQLGNILNYLEGRGYRPIDQSYREIKFICDQYKE